MEPGDTNDLMQASTQAKFGQGILSRRDFLMLGAGTGATLAVLPHLSIVRAASLKSAAAESTVMWDHYSLSIANERQFIWSGEFHYWRLPSPDLWRDVLQKMKAAGYNAASIYLDWGYHSPKQGVYDFTGVRDVEQLLKIAEEVGIWVIARPGPYINAETDSGGFPGWLVTQKGRARSSAADYTAAYQEWLSALDPILARHQITRGGCVILYQVENEYTFGPLDPTYMQQLEAKVRADGIDVPLSHNDVYLAGTWSTGPGAVDIYGFDGYPQGFNASNPQHWSGVYTGLEGSHDAHVPNEPIYIAEFQGGSFDPWGGAGYDKCRELTNAAFESVFYKSNIAQRITLTSYYMTYGGTSWGWLPEPGVYSSYDYGAALDEARQLTDKYGEQKLLGYLVQTVVPLRKTDPTSSGSTSNLAIRLDARINPDDKTQFYILRHQDSTSTNNDTTSISINLEPRSGYTYDDTASALVYTGNWSHVANQSYTGGDYDNTESFSNTAGDSVAITFTGTAVRWISSKDSNHGIANVYLDGAQVATVDTYASNKQFQVPLYSNTNLPSGTHTLKIVVSGQKNPSSADTFIVVDAIDLPPASQPGEYYPTVPQQTSTTIRLNGRDSKLLVINYDLGAQRLIYSTSELMTHATIGSRDVAILYGRQGEDGETVLRYATQPKVTTLTGSVTSSWDATRGDLRLNYTHSGLLRVLVSGGTRDLLLLIAEDGVAESFWWQDTDAGTAFIRGPYLVRMAAAASSGGQLALTGDTAQNSDLEVFAPPSVAGVSWNGQVVPTQKTSSGSLQGALSGPASVQLPALSTWKFQFGSPERDPAFDDSQWTVADHTTTNNPNPPTTLPVLYMDDYGYHHGDVWYRGHFTAAGTETGITLDGEGGDHSAYTVWLNGASLGSASGTHTFAFPTGSLRQGKDNVIAVLLENMGHDEDFRSGDSQKDPRGLRQAALQGSNATLSWRIQGNLGGENLVDTARGPMNVGGLYGERHGWQLPGYPDAPWASVSLPHSFAKDGLPAGVGWYRTAFNLSLPQGTDIPIGLRIDDDPGRHYRALIFINGWMMGHYINDLGPQHLFSLPTGLLNPNGSNEIAIASWAQDGTTGGLGKVTLEAYGTYAGGIPVKQVAAPGYSSQTYGPPVLPTNPTLALTSSSYLLDAGGAVKLVATFSNHGQNALTNVSLTLHAPDGWALSPSDPVTVDDVDPGQSATATWTATAPKSVAAGTLQLVSEASYENQGQASSVLGTVTLAVPYAALSDAFNNIGIADDNNLPGPADFDGTHYNYSGQALAAVGLTPGAIVTHDGASFTWPNAPYATLDNVVARGQTVKLPGSGSQLAFLGAGSSGNPSGSGTVYYSDGSTSTFVLTLGDYYYGAISGNETVATTAYADSGANRANHQLRVFYAAVGITVGKQISAITLPNASPGPQGHQTAMHIFAVAVK